MIRHIVLVLLCAGCGAKTDLEIETYDLDGGMDAGRDAGRDAGPDASFDANVCLPGEVALEASETDVVFVIDRSGSMLQSFDGTTPGPGNPTRWETLEAAMRGALASFDDPRIAVGGKFFPSRSRRVETDSCAVYDGLDVPIGPGRSAGILAQFDMWDPAGGTPIAEAVQEAVEALEVRADGRRAQFIVLETDGAPSCGFDAFDRALAVVTDAHELLDIDVLVVGIASTDPEVFALDELARSGGRPRTGERAFYDARDSELLGTLLSDITRDLARCIFAVPRPPDPEDEIDVLVGGAPVPRDELRVDGWDWTSDGRGQLGLFGTACASAIANGGDVRAIITCH